MTKQERILHIQKINASGLTTQAKIDALKSFVEQEKKADEEEKKNQDKLDIELKDLVKTLTETEKKETQFIGILKGEDGKDSEVPGPKGDKGEKGDTGLQGIPGPKGEKGDKGDTPSQKELLKLIAPLIPEPIKGEDGEDAEIETIVSLVLKQLSSKKAKEKLHIKNIEGVSELQDTIVTHAVTQARGLLYAGLLENRSTGSGGFTRETPTGTIDGANSTFTVTHVPNYVISDGLTIFDGAGYTIAGLTLTITVPPQEYIRSYY